MEHSLNISNRLDYFKSSLARNPLENDKRIEIQSTKYYAKGETTLK